jgi:hypothetical protein
LQDFDRPRIKERVFLLRHFANNALIVFRLTNKHTKLFSTIRRTNPLIPYKDHFDAYNQLWFKYANSCNCFEKRHQTMAFLEFTVPRAILKGNQAFGRYNKAWVLLTTPLAFSVFFSEPLQPLLIKQQISCLCSFASFSWYFLCIYVFVVVVVVFR